MKLQERDNNSKRARCPEIEFGCLPLLSSQFGSFITKFIWQPLETILIQKERLEVPGNIEMHNLQLASVPVRPWTKAKVYILKARLFSDY